jgi:hypothetical protein
MWDVGWRMLDVPGNITLKIPEESQNAKVKNKKSKLKFQ